MAANKIVDLFEQSAFQYTFKNVPIPELNSNSKALAEAIETDSALYSIQKYKARMSSRVKPIILKEKGGEKGKQLAYKFRKMNASTDKFVKQEAQELRTKAFEEIYLDDITEKSDLFSLKKLLTQPNDYQSFAQFLESYSFNVDNGWCPIWGVRLASGINKGKYQNLYVLPSHLIEIIGGGQMEPISGYRFKNNYNKSQEFKKEDVIRLSSHSPRFDSHGGHLYGTSKIKVAWSDFQVRVKALERKYTNFSNGDLRSLITPKPEHAESFDGESKLKSLKDTIIRAFRTLLPQRLALLGVPIEVHHFQNEIAEQLLKEAEEMAIRVACSVWGIDQAVVFSDNSGAKYNNHGVMVAESLRLGVFPELIQLESALNNHVVKPYYPGYSIMFDYDVYEELNNDIFKEIETLSKANWIPINTKLRWIDQEPIDDPKADIPESLWDFSNDLNFDDAEL